MSAEARAVRIARVTGAVVGLAPIPFAVWAPATTPVTVGLTAVAIAAALHGLGRLVEWLAGDEDAPLGLVCAWGLAAYVGVAGLLAALNLLVPEARAALLVAGITLHAGRLSRTAAYLAARRMPVRPALVAASVLAIAIGGMLVLASAARWYGPFTDGESDTLAQLDSFEANGGFVSDRSYQRATNLGGQHVVGALAGALDPRAHLLVDRGLLFGLVVLLMATATRTRAARVGATALVPIVLTAVPEYLLRAAPMWSTVGLVLATAFGFERAIQRRSASGLALAVLTAAAGATLRHPAVVLVAIVGVAAYLRARRGDVAGQRWPLLVIPLVVLVPYVAAAMADIGIALHPRPGALGMTLAGGLVVTVLVGLALGRRPGRDGALAACATLGVAGACAPSSAQLLAEVLPIVIGLALVIGNATLSDPSALDEVGPGRSPFGAQVAFATAVVGLLALAPFATGKPVLSWQTRIGLLLYDARSLSGLPRWRNAPRASPQGRRDASSRSSVDVDDRSGTSGTNSILPP